MRLLASCLISISVLSIAAWADLRADLNAFIKSKNLPIGKKNTKPDNKEVTEWAGLGDSFAAGIGAGIYDGYSQGCSRYSDAMSQQMNANPRFPGDPKSRKFVNGACSGALVDEVPNLQLVKGDAKGEHPGIGKPEIVTVSFSGNDADFGGIIRNCVYEFLAPKTCAQQKTESWSILKDADGSLHKKLTDALVKIYGAGIAFGGAKPAEAFQIYVTSYVPFFNQDTTACDKVSFAKRLFGGGWDGEKLTTAKRKELNSMVDALNKILMTVVSVLHDDNGYNIFFVDSDAGAYNGHRFCELGPDPNKVPDQTAPNVWFYDWDSPWNDEPHLTGDQSSTPKGTGELIMKNFCPNNKDPVNDQTISPDLKKCDPKLSKNFLTIESGGVPLPERTRRVFHPKKPGMGSTANNVIEKYLVEVAAAGAFTASNALPRPTTPPIPPPAPAAPKRKCTQKIDVGGRGVIYGHHCTCDNGDKFEATIDPVRKLYTCGPDQVTLIAKRTAVPNPLTRRETLASPLPAAGGPQETGFVA